MSHSRRPKYRKHRQLKHKCHFCPKKGIIPVSHLHFCKDCIKKVL